MTDRRIPPPPATSTSAAADIHFMLTVGYGSTGNVETTVFACDADGRRGVEGLSTTTPVEATCSDCLWAITDMNTAAILANWSGPGRAPHVVAHRDTRTGVSTFHLRGAAHHAARVFAALRMADGAGDLVAVREEIRQHLTIAEELAPLWNREGGANGELLRKVLAALDSAFVVDVPATSGVARAMPPRKRGDVDG